MSEEIIDSIPENIQVKLPTLEELRDMSPEDVQKIVLEYQNDNTKNTSIQKNAIVAAMGEVNYLKVLTAVASYLPKPLDGLKPENSRKMFFHSVATIANRIQEHDDKDLYEAGLLNGTVEKQLPGLETDKNEVLEISLYRDFKLAINHFIYLINLESGGFGLRKDNEGKDIDINPMATSLIYDMFVNTVRIGNLLTNFSKNAEGCTNPEHRLLDMLIVHNVDMGNVLGSVTMTLNSLIDVKFTTMYPDVEPTVMAKTDLLLSIFDALNEDRDYIVNYEQTKNDAEHVNGVE